MADAVIKGQSDSYDLTLKKIIDLNRKLNDELKKSKGYLESTNEIYKNLSTQTQSFASSLGSIIGVSTAGSRNATESIEKVQKEVNKLRGSAESQGLKAIQSSIKNIAGMLKGNSNFANILTNSLKSTITTSQSFQTAMAASSSSMATAGASSAGASAGVAGVGTAAIGTASAVLGLVAAIAALIAMMYKLGEGGYKFEMTITNSQKVLGNSFKTAYEWANKMNDELGIAQDRTMSLIASTAQIAKTTGIDTTSSANMGIATNRMAVAISNSTGVDLETVQGQINSYLQGSNSLSAYGINNDTNAAKYAFEAHTGISSFNAALNDSNMLMARYYLLMDQYNQINYKSSENTQSLAAMQLKLKNTMDSLSKYAQAIFIPIFQAITEVLVKLAEATLWVVNCFRELLGLDKISIDASDTQGGVDAAAELYSNYKKAGDELDALKQQLYGFDEVITQNPFINEIPTLSLADAGLLDVIDESGSVKDGVKYGEGFVEGFKKVLSKMGPLGQTLGDFFNVDHTEWEKMTETQQWLNQPARKFIELEEAGDATAWDFLKAVGLESLHELPIVSEIEALINGDGADFLKSVIKDGLLFNPITWPIGLLWKGFDIISKFKDENGSWDVLIRFLKLDKLKEGFQEAVNWLYTNLSGFGSWVSTQIQSALSAINPMNWFNSASNYIAVNYSSGKGLSGFGGSFLSGLLPSYASGGFIKAAHIAQLDPGEVAVPLNNASATPVFKTMADRVTENMGASAGGNITVNVHLGENGAIIADNYSLQKFSKKIGENVAQQLKSTGQLSFGRRY